MVENPVRAITEEDRRTQASTEASLVNLINYDNYQLRTVTNNEFYQESNFIFLK